MAKAASLADTLGKHLECAVCLDQYTEPKVLPCLHTFCKRCLQGLLKHEGAVWKLICPTCRSSAEVSLNLFEQSFSEGLIVSSINGTVFSSVLGLASQMQILPLKLFRSVLTKKKDENQVLTISEGGGRTVSLLLRAVVLKQP